MTKPRAHTAETPEVVREILRRAGHELRNALNGVAVNVEVVRSKADREGSPKELASFAARASAQVGEASALTDGLLAFVGAVVAAQAAGTLKTTGDGGAASRIELMIYGDRSAGTVSEIERLTNRVGVGIEQNGQRVILTVLPQGNKNSKD